MLNHCQINNFRITKQVGSGAYGVVFHAIDLVTENEYAIKAVTGCDKSGDEMTASGVLQARLYHYFKTSQYSISLPIVKIETVLSLTEDDLKRSPHYREIFLHLKCHSHENVVTIHQILESPLATFIVMDYYDTDLFNSIVNEQHFAIDGFLLKKVFLQLCSVISHCHYNGVYHCDIKPENILLDARSNVRLCDFGLATTSPIVKPNECVGSSYYMAPERISYPTSIVEEQNEKYFPTCKCDIWSLGIILINLTCSRNPWLKAHQKQDKTFNCFSNDPTVLKKILPISDELFLIVQQVLRLDPYSRIDLDSLMLAVSLCRQFTVSGPLSDVHSFSEEQFEKYIGDEESYMVKDMLRRYENDNKYSSDDSYMMFYCSDDEVEYLSNHDLSPYNSFIPCSAQSSSLQMGPLNMNVSTMTNYSNKSQVNQPPNYWNPQHSSILRS